MTIDDNDGNGPRKSRGDTNNPTRDARGRWLPDHCPNPKGRPRKMPKVYVDQADLRMFGNTQIDLMANGQRETMDRRAALLSKMFETAMKGSVYMQRYLYEQFEGNTKLMAATRAHYDQLVMDYVINNPKLGEPDYDIPVEIRADMQRLRTVLNHYFPNDYPLDGK